MTICQSDILLLQKGLPPENDGLLVEMTCRSDLWLNRMRDYQLDYHIRSGGSKVKIVIGKPGSGKSQMLRWLAVEARRLGYLSIYTNLRSIHWKLSDMPCLYRYVASFIDKERIVAGLCFNVANRLGYGSEYDGSKSLEDFAALKGIERNQARQRIIEMTYQLINEADLSPAFKTFVCTLVAHATGVNENIVELCWKWFEGTRLERNEKKATRLHDTLAKQTGRIWLYSLIRLLRISGYSGLVLLIDDCEAITERDAITKRFRYTPSVVKDFYELIRQLIDDVELLEHLFVVLSGRDEFEHDEKRGINSYMALLMRLQSGIISIDGFNPLSDRVDTSRMLREVGEAKFAREAGMHILSVLKNHGFTNRAPDGYMAKSEKLRNAVVELTSTVVLPGE